MSSSIFEQMLFGPMAIAELKLPDDNPEAFKTCNENCNEVSISILPSDIDQAMMVISGNYHSCITNLNATTAHLATIKGHTANFELFSYGGLIILSGCW